MIMVSRISEVAAIVRDATTEMGTAKTGAETKLESDQKVKGRRRMIMMSTISEMVTTRDATMEAGAAEGAGAAGMQQGMLIRNGTHMLVQATRRNDRIVDVQVHG